MKDKIYLTQTDTTVGFLSKSMKALNKAKKRPLNTPCIKAVCDLKELKTHARVPKKYKNLVRKAKNTSIIYPNNQSIRVIKEHSHKEFLTPFRWLYTTSANLTNKGFDKKYATKIADEIYGIKKLHENSPSTMIKLNNKKGVKIR